MKTLHQNYTAWDIAAFFLIHKLWFFLSERNDCDPNYFEVKINKITSARFDYKVVTELLAEDIEFKMEFTLIRYKATGTLRGQGYWGLAEDGLRLKLKIDGGYRYLVFYTHEDGTLYPAPESVEAVVKAQRLWKEVIG